MSVRIDVKRVKKMRTMAGNYKQDALMKINTCENKNRGNAQHEKKEPKNRDKIDLMPGECRGGASRQGKSNAADQSTRDNKESHKHILTRLTPVDLFFREVRSRLQEPR